MAKAPTGGSANVPATKTKTNLPTTTSFGEFEAMTADVGSGLENVTAADLLIPRLTILQGLSPQLVRTKPEYDPQAHVGEIYDIGMQERLPESIDFLFVHYDKKWLEWAPRSSGKGLQAIHDTPAILAKCVKDDKNRDILPNGNLVTETMQFYGMNITAGWRKSFIPMASTQLKKGRRILTLATGERLTRSDGSEFQPPLFYRTYKLTTVPESNSEGDWIGWKIERGPSLDEVEGWQQRMHDIKDFRDALTKGDIAGDIAAMAEEVGNTMNSDTKAM